MHAMVNVLLIGLCLEIITVVVVLHFLAKVKTQNLGNGMKWLGNILLILGFLAIGCNLARGVMGIMHKGHETEQCSPMMMGGHHGCGMHQDCCEGKEGCEGKDDCDEHEGKMCPMDKDSMKVKDAKSDSTKGKK